MSDGNDRLSIVAVVVLAMIATLVFTGAEDGDLIDETLELEATIAL